LGSCTQNYSTPTEDVNQALQETGLRMLGLNTQRGDISRGDNGVAAVPGREREARQYIDQAVDYAHEIGCANVHVMAGITNQDATAESTFRGNLAYACERAAPAKITILIEPLNHYDAPDYHLCTLDAAVKTIEAVAADNIKVMFDCYHLQIMQGDLTRRLRENLSLIGHIQIASVPDRAEPDDGELSYPHIMRVLDGLGWDTPIGAEYKPRNGTAAGLDWMHAYR
jgi:hydroxypyruvate isomerase